MECQKRIYKDKYQCLTLEKQKSQNDMEKLKYNYTTLKEYTDQELLSMEKEMLGIYISGHPLEKYREQIAKQANINTLQIREFEQLSQAEMEKSRTIR